MAGKCLGMAKDSETRSSLLWQVGRILNECKEQNCLPTVLLLENVTQVHGTKNLDDWNTWLHTLEELGYHNYWKDLRASDFGVPQNRERCFCISLLSDKLYTFPDEIGCKKCIKDFLEPHIPENYYIETPKAKAFIEHYNNRKLDELPKDKPLGNLTPADNEKIHQRNFVFNEYGISPTLTATQFKDPIRVFCEED